MSKIKLDDLKTLELDLFVKVGDTYCKIGSIDCPVALTGPRYGLIDAIAGWGANPRDVGITLLPDITSLMSQLSPTKAEAKAEAEKKAADEAPKSEAKE